MKPAGETSKNTKEKLVARGSHIAAIGHVPLVQPALRKRVQLAGLMSHMRSLRSRLYSHFFCGHVLQFIAIIRLSRGNYLFLVYGLFLVTRELFLDSLRAIAVFISYIHASRCCCA